MWQRGRNSEKRIQPEHPRYVDTFEEEEVVDIAAVQANIARLKQEIAEAEAKMDVYLKELACNNAKSKEVTR